MRTQTVPFDESKSQQEDRMEGSEEGTIHTNAHTCFSGKDR